jgi:hypothetical protein
VSDFLSLTIELTALDAECAARHLRKLADQVEANPQAAGWETSDIEGSAVADRNKEEEA